MAIGRPVKFDWVTLFENFTKSPDTLRKFCENNGLSYSNASREFAKVETEIANGLFRKTKNRLAAYAPTAVTKLGGLLDSADERVSASASTAILDRAGFSPAAVNVQIQNNIVQNVVIPPVFAQSSAEDFKALLQGGPVIDAVTEDTDDKPD